jgi:hypothetical protein
LETDFSLLAHQMKEIEVPALNFPVKPIRERGCEGKIRQLARDHSFTVDF